MICLKIGFDIKNIKIAPLTQFSNGTETFSYPIKTMKIWWRYNNNISTHSKYIKTNSSKVTY